MIRLMIATAVVGLSCLYAAPQPRMDLTWEPRLSFLERPPQLVARVVGGDWVCAGYQLLEVGDRTPYERPTFYIPIMRVSCRQIDDPISRETVRFEFNRLIDGKYLVFGWLEREGKIVSRPLDQEMVIR